MEQYQSNSDDKTWNSIFKKLQLSKIKNPKIADEFPRIMNWNKQKSRNLNHWKLIATKNELQQMEIIWRFSVMRAFQTKRGKICRPWQEYARISFLIIILSNFHICWAQWNLHEIGKLYVKYVKFTSNWMIFIPQPTQNTRTRISLSHFRWLWLGRR